MSLEFLDMLSSLMGISLSLFSRKACFAFILFITRWKMVIHGAVDGHIHDCLSCSDSNRTVTVDVLEKLCMNFVMVCQLGLAVIRELKIIMLLFLC